jgi:hypothetical protein
MIAGGATVIDLAAYLGVTPRRVRQVIAEASIQPVGQLWKAKLYPPRPVIEYVEELRKRRAS